MLHPHHKTIILSVISQIPMVLLLIIFFRIPVLPTLYRTMAVITVLLEAAILSELIGNIVQRVRADEKGIIVRKVFERERIPWKDVRGVCHVVLSPLRKGGTRLPSKLLLIKTREDAQLAPAMQWWKKKGPLANRRSGMAQLVERYDAYVAKKLRGWSIIWAIDYHQPQEHTDDVEAEYVAVDDRERSVINDLKTYGGTKVKSISFTDLTYPTYVKRHGGKYANDVEHVWETVE